MRRFIYNLRKLGVLLILALAALTNTGCIEARYSYYYRYDEAKDTFSYLHIFSDIGAGEVTYVSTGKFLRRVRVEHHSDRTNELGYLYALTQKKQDIIVLPMPGILGGPPAYVRLGDRKVQEIQLHGPRFEFRDKLEYPEPSELAVDISGIKIKPGAFFLNERKHLCYFHETEIPGSVADQLLAALNKAASPELVAKLNEAIKTDGNPDLPRISWDDLRKQLADKIKQRNQPAKKTDPSTAEPMTRGPLELASLEMLRKAAAADKLGIKRKGSRLLLQVPLTKADSLQLIATLDLVKKTMLEEVAKAGPDAADEDAKKLLAAVKATITNGFAYKLDPNQGILFEVELARLFRLANMFTDVQERTPYSKGSPEGESHYQLKCRATVTAMEGRGVEILRAFDADKLRAPYLFSKK